MDQPIASLIRHLRKFGHIPDDRARLIEGYFALELVPGGGFYLRENKVSYHSGFIAEGVMRYCNIGADGELLTCYFVAENDLAGDPESFARQTPSKLILQAVTDTLVVTISRDRYEALIARFPEFERIAAQMAQAFMTSLINQRSFLLNNDAKSKYLHFLEHFPHILNRVPLGMVATYLGIKQQSLSRLRAGL